MKPFVVYVDVNTDKITLSKEEFEKYLKEAYERGHEDGYNKGLAQGRSYLGWWNSPTITTATTTGEIRYDTTSSPKPNSITITCDNDRNSILNKTMSDIFNAVGD